MYVLHDEARWRWQHAISPTKALRYSITFRTMVVATDRLLRGPSGAIDAAATE